MTLTLTTSGSNYLLTSLDQTVETYNATGQLLSIVTRDGYAQTLCYDTTGSACYSSNSGKLMKVSDTLGRALSFTYNSSGLLATMTDPNGKVYSYAYVTTLPSYTTAIPSMSLSTVTYPPTGSNPSPVITYHYGYTTPDGINFPSLMTSISDELNNTIAQWTFDDDGRALTSSSAGGLNSYSFSYSADPSSTPTRTVTSPLGEVVTYTYTVLQNMLKLSSETRTANSTVPAGTQSYGYDSNGFLNSFTDWNGNLTTYVNNSLGEQTSRTEASGTAQARTITTSWNATWNLPAEIVEPKRTIDFTYDSHGNLSQRKETDTTTQTVPYSTNGQTHIWNYTYTTTAPYLLLTVTGPRTDVTQTTTYTYTTDAAQNIATVSDALGHVTHITSYDASGRPLTLTDPNNTTTTLTYDPLGRVASVTVGTGGPLTSITYNAAGLVSKLTNPDGTYLTYGYDNAQRLTGLTANDGSSIAYTLDNAGNITQASAKNTSGVVRFTQSHSYDALSRLLKNIGYLSAQATTYGYDGNGNGTSSTDARSNATGFAFDALNRLITTTDPLTHSAATSYDAADNVTAQNDFGGNTTSYVYNGFHQVIQVAALETGTTVYTLDKAGNRTAETDALGYTTSRNFDALDRVTAETSTLPGDNTTYTYDETAKTGVGHLTYATDASGTTSLNYDGRGNVIAAGIYVGSRFYSVNTSYSVMNAPTLITYPDGRQVQIVYNATTGKPQYVNTRPNSSGTWSVVAGSITYEPFGPSSGFTYGNGAVFTRSTNQNYWPTELKVTTSGAAIQQDLVLGYDNDGNVTVSTDNFNSGRSQSFTIDGLNRITHVNAGGYGIADYTYDAPGNRSTFAMSGATSTYNYTNNRLYSISGGTARTFHYNADGQMSSDSLNTATYGYSRRHRLTTATSGSTTANYAYNIFGERALKTIGSTATAFIYDTSGHLLGEYNNTTGAMIREYIWLGDLPVAQIESSGSPNYIATDASGTPHLMTDGSDSISYVRYQEPFGQSFEIDYTGTTPLRFPGQYADSETGLNQNGFRDYAQTLGRYVEPDPIGQAGGLWPYGYAGQNPLIYSDPKGECPFCIIALLAFDASLINVNHQLQENGGNFHCVNFKQAGLAGVEAFGGIVGGASVLDALFLDGAAEAASGLGDLTSGEAGQIQNVVDAAGRPLDVVGSAARGSRTASSDIDYTTANANFGNFEGLQDQLPSIDTEHGLLRGYADPNVGPSVRFEPGTNPYFVPGQP